VSATTKFVLTPDEARRYFEARLGKLPQRKEVPFRCPFHQDRTASGSVNLKDGTWYCHTCKVGGGIFAFEKRLNGSSNRECWDRICAIIGRPNPNGHQASRPSTPRTIAATYDYTDRDGKLLYQAVRFKPKGFSQRRHDGKRWIWNLDGITTVLYDLPGVLRANVVAIVEGEKDKHNFDKAAASFPNDGKSIYVATTNAMGAGKWRDEYSTCLAGKKVLIFGDNDNVGRKHVDEVSASASQYAQGVHVVDLPGLPEKGDLSDYLKNHTPAELYALLQAVPDRITGASKAAPADGKTAAPLTSEMLLQCRKWIERFVVLSEQQAIVCSVWLLHTYVWEIASKTPYLHIYSAEKEEGKTQLVATLAALSNKPLTAEEISASALRRVPGQLKPTLFLDEMDAMMKGDKEKAEIVRGLLNSGFRSKGCALLCAGKDKNFALERYPSFCPKVLAGIGQLWDTVAGRSIPIELHRMRPGQSVEDIDDDDIVEAQAQPLRADLKRWGEWALPHLKQISVEKVPGLGHRQQNISKQLMQIANLAGPEWTKALTQATDRDPGELAMGGLDALTFHASNA
jgi:CHC2 zinc finger/Protein of unknown function (DUF3631)